jgi:hypothetical protein
MSHHDKKPIPVVVEGNPSPTKEYDEFYKWVGICIKGWAAVEDTMFELCALVLKADPKHVSIIYYRTPTIDARLTLTSDLVASVLPQKKRKDGGHDHPDLLKWNKLVKDTKSLLKVRNQLAHASVGLQVGPKSWLLQVLTGKNERLRGKEKPPVKDSELPGHYAAVQSIANRFSDFKQLLALPE